MRITKNFSLNEFDSRDGVPVPTELIPNIVRLADCLQIIRDTIQAPLHINSAYRSPSHNKKVGGAHNSQHLYGKAADITSRNHTPHQLFVIIDRLIKEGKIREGGLAEYKGFVHYDIRGVKARW
jgi:uncharacterized protein YcbK (DUF882 family)